MSDRVAFVTGGTSGIGRAACLEFARTGTRVVLTGRDSGRGEAVVQAIRAGGGEAGFIEADLGRPGEAERVVRDAIGLFGRLDYAFNNAAATHGVGRLTVDLDEPEFDEVMMVNAKAVWLLMKYEIRQMLAQAPPGGSIVNTSSVNGLGGIPGGSVYAASKAAVMALTKSAALEYGRQGVRVNALVAGGFDTPMLRGVFERAGGDAEGAAAVRQGFEQQIPLARIGDPREAARTVVWLCSDAASYVTGHSMIVDGGLTSPYR
jgi:NAD(P)-dependent dehydrogenase (short-subunit alcohol dehydrogenase family)